MGKDAPFPNYGISERQGVVSWEIKILKEAVDFKAFNDSDFHSAGFSSSSLPTDSVDQPTHAAHLLLNSSSNTILSITLPSPSAGFTPKGLVQPFDMISKPVAVNSD